MDKARPTHIEQGRLEGNTELLSAAGRQGGLTTAARRDAQRIMNERIVEQRQNEEYQRAVQAGEIQEDPRNTIYD